MKLTDQKLQELLVKPSHVSEADFKEALQLAKKEKKSVQEVLVASELIRDEELGQVIAYAFDLQFVDLRRENIDPEALRLIPELVARSRGVIVFGRTPQGVKVGMVDPTDLATLHLVEKRIGQPLIPYLVTERALQDVLARYKTGIKEQIDSILLQLQDPSAAREERDEATVKIVDALVLYGYQNNSSDIHIEPHVANILVRFRIDGVLHDLLEMPKDLGEFLLTRIKILSGMRTDEHRAAQDGKFRFFVNHEGAPSHEETAEGVVDVRVSIVPVTEGENAVLRILSAGNRQFNLPDLGFSEVDLKKVEPAIKNPHGMILSTGPTGSGKTTTLYAILKILNKREVHIATIEDPVEYDVEGLSQIQVDARTNLTFAKGLRAIVRQDPDIIMVGEIRDEETAGIAVNSALTGHLVLSTLHTNDAATTLPRLLDMGVEAFLVASTVRIVVAQRLVRRICKKCLVSRSLSPEEAKIINSQEFLKDIFKKKGYRDLKKITVFQGVGCKACGSTGYLGRIGIFEVLEMKENIRELVLARASSDKITEVARSNGMTTMLEDGFEKILTGITTIEEVLRVTRI